MRTDKQQTGDYGEALVALQYENEGYAVLARNFRSRFGELDLVLSRNGTVVFCEVKTRNAGSRSLPRESVDYKKQVRIIKAAQDWLVMNCQFDSNVRFDVAEVILSKQGLPKINILHSAFDNIG